MGGVILQLPRQQAPNTPLAIDWSNPLTAGLRRAWFASTGLDHVSGARATNNSPSNNVPGQNQYGQTLRCSGAQAMQSYTLPNIAGMSKEFTVLTVSTTLSGDPPLAGVWGSSGNRQFYLAINTSRQPLVAVTDGAVNRIYTATSATVSASRTVVAGGWKASGDVCSLWVNGFPVAGTKTGTAVSSLPSTSLPVSIATQSTGGSAALSGDIELVLIFSRLLSDVEIRALTINPYQILRSRRNYIVDAITGLSSVSNDVVLSYNLLSYAQQDKTIEWNILNSVNTDGSVSWDINTSVTSDKTFSWDALNQVIADKVIEWNLEQYVQSDKGMSWDILNNVVSDGILSWNTTSSVTTDVNTTWNIVSSVFTDKTINYDILVSANQDVSLSWNINQFVFADKGLVWDIESTMLTAFADLPLRYDIVSSVYKDFNAHWNLLQSAYSDNTVSFNILNSVVQDQSIAWGISEAVVNDLIITANLLSATQQDLTLVWDSAGKVGNDLVIRYNISTQDSILPPLSRMLVISQDTRTLKVNKFSRTISIQ